MAAPHRLLTLCCLCVLGCTQGLADGDGPEKAACIDSHEGDESSAMQRQAPRTNHTLYQSHPLRRKRVRQRIWRMFRALADAIRERRYSKSGIPAFSVVDCSERDDFLIGPSAIFRDLLNVAARPQAHMRAGLGTMAGDLRAASEAFSGAAAGDVFSPTGAGSTGELTWSYQAPAEGRVGFVRQTYVSEDGIKEHTFGDIFYQGDACPGPTERPANCFPSSDPPPAGCSEANWDSRTDEDCFNQSGINVLAIVSWICFRPLLPFLGS